MIEIKTMQLLYPAIWAISTIALRAETPNPEMVFDRPQSTTDQIGFHAHLGYESRYVSEGRDNLDGDGIATGTLEVGWKHLSFGAWYANSPQSSYDEFQLNTALTQEWGDFEFYLAYTYLDLPDASTHDHEVGLGLTWDGLPYGVILALESYYSFESTGSFINLTCARDFEWNECLTISPSVTFGVNQGYISDGHDGANHLAINLGAEYSFTESLAAAGHIAYNFAIDREALRPGDLLLDDFFHAGVELVWTF